MYFNPGCALSIYKPEMEQRLLAFLNKHYGVVELHKICCHHAPQVAAGSLIINVCAGCDRRFGSLYEGVSTVSLWEVLADLGVFPYPDYHGLAMSIHDPCPVREKPAVHDAVRTLLQKMNVQVVEAKQHGTQSVCCGDMYYPKYPQEKIKVKMQERAVTMPCEDVVVYCVSCVKALYIGGKKPRHLVDLLFSETTTPGVYDTLEWHSQIEAYIEEH